MCTVYFFILICIYANIHLWAICVTFAFFADVFQAIEHAIIPVSASQEASFFWPFGKWICQGNQTESSSLICCYIQTDDGNAQKDSFTLGVDAGLTMGSKLMTIHTLNNFHPLVNPEINFNPG